MDEKKISDFKWYEISVTPGMELQVAKEIKQKVITYPPSFNDKDAWEKYILQRKTSPFPPARESVHVIKDYWEEEEGGKVVWKEKILFPGYLLVKIFPIDENFKKIVALPHVLGFFGDDNKVEGVETCPSPLYEEQITNENKECIGSIATLREKRGYMDECLSHYLEMEWKWAFRYINPKAGIKGNRLFKIYD